MTTIWGYPAKLVLEMHDGRDLVLDDFLKIEGHEVKLDFDKVLDRLNEAWLEAKPKPLLCPLCHGLEHQPLHGCPHSYHMKKGGE